MSKFNITVNGGNNQFGSIGMEQEVMDALREQAELSCSNHYFNHDAILFGAYEQNRGIVPDYVRDHWKDYLTPKAAALYTKMEDIVNNRP